MAGPGVALEVAEEEVEEKIRHGLKWIKVRGVIGSKKGGREGGREREGSHLHVRRCLAAGDHGSGRRHPSLCLGGRAERGKKTGGFLNVQGEVVTVAADAAARSSERDKGPVNTAD